MNRQNWERKEYETWDDAFRGLSPAVRQQSVRVAAYTQVLFVQACASGFGADTPQGAARMRGQYGDLAYKCGLYHQLGKSLVPPEYQVWEKDFTQEEQAVYRKYTTDGRVLVATLQERGAAKLRKRNLTGFQEQPTDNIPWLMIRESCQQHMERWDGSGYPDGRKGDEISPIAQIVGIARELDRLASQTKSEDPFGEAMAELLSQKGTCWSEKLTDVLEGAREKCREVYRKYIHYTMALPKTIPLVEKRPERPMGLRYRPMVSRPGGNPVAYEAVGYLADLDNGQGEKLTALERQEMLRRTGIDVEVMFYFLYEAADTLYRLDNCKLEHQGILVQMLPGFYQSGSQLQRFIKLFEDQPVSRDKLLLTIPAQTVAEANKGTTEVISRYLRNGLQLVVDQYNPEQISPEQLKTMGFTWLRLAPELYLQQSTANTMQQLLREGFRIVGGNADTQDSLKWQLSGGAAFTGGTMTGVPVTEDELIRDALLKERAGYGD